MTQLKFDDKKEVFRVKCEVCESEYELTLPIDEIIKIVRFSAISDLRKELLEHIDEVEYAAGWDNDSDLAYLNALYMVRDKIIGDGSPLQKSHEVK